MQMLFGTHQAMHVVFRVEGGPDVGMGHISRCMVLAEQLSCHGATVSFLCTKTTDTIIQQRLPQITGSNSTIITFGLSEDQDAVKCASMLELLKLKADWLVVDHYRLGREWEQIQCQVVRRLMSIDDLGRDHACDLLLDQNY